MRKGRFPAMVALVAMLSACGGGGGSTTGSPIQVTPAPGSSTPTPTATTTAGCSLRERQDWALSQLREWYLFPDLLDTGASPGSYTTVQDYIDALVAPARAQSKDRYFTYITSIAQENAFYQQGASAGFGVRLTYDSTAQRVFVAEAFEGAPALAAGIDRGTEIIAIGTSTSNLQTVKSLFTAGGAAAVSDALGPSTAGVSRVLRVIINGVQQDLTITKTSYELTPVSSRYGVKVIDNGGQKVGYINLRTFIDSADPALRSAVDTLRAQGITNVIVDLRYNGGGLVSISELFGSLLGAGRAGQVFSYTTFRPEKSNNNSTHNFQPTSQSIAPMKIAFIGTTSTASASELLINAFKPYLGANAGLIGTNTYGKPVGQVALDKSSCDDRLRAIAFRTENANHEGDYYTGLATRVAASCAASDDLSFQLGDPNEASVKTALDFLAGRSCTPISTSGQTTQALRASRQVLQVLNGTTEQREVPGSF